MKNGTEGIEKFEDLEERLGVPRWQAVGILQTLWLYTAKNWPAGNIGAASNVKIARWLRYEGDADDLIAALVETGWVDEHPEHRLIIHDWSEHCEDSIRMKLARAGQLFADGTSPKTSRLSTKEREVCAQRAHGVRTDSARRADGVRTSGTESYTESGTESYTNAESGTESGPGPDECPEPDSADLHRDVSEPEGVSDGPMADVLGVVRAAALAAPSVDSVVQSLAALARDRVWADWIEDTGRRIASVNGGVFALDEWRRKLEDAASPAARKAKDVGEFRAPGKWLVKQMTEYAKAHGIERLSTPGAKRVAARGSP